MSKFQTTPLVKSILTGEGILVYATNIALALFAAIPHSLSWTHAGLYIAIVTAVNVVSRTLLKIVAVQKGVGLPPAPTIDPLDPSVISGLIGSTIQDIQQAEKDAKAAQEAPGTPAEKVTAGLAPEPASA